MTDYFDENAARHSHGLFQPPSKTIKRPPRRCRVVVTVEVELSLEMMKAGRNMHLYDSVDTMRAILAPYSEIGSAAECLDELRHDGELSIVSTKIEANK